MKNVVLTKKQVVLFALIILPIIGFSQSKSNNGNGNNGNGQRDKWSLDGNAAQNKDVLGTTNNQSLQVITNDSLRMEIKANGDVQVNKNMSIIGKLDVGTINNSSLSLNTENTPRLLINPAGDVQLYNNLSINGLLNANTISGDNLLFKTNNLSRFSILNNGDVQAENNMNILGNLQVGKDISVSGKLNAGSINNNTISFNTNDMPRMLINPDGNVQINNNLNVNGTLNTNSINGNDLIFKTGNTPRFSIFSNGNVQAENNMIVNGNIQVKGLGGDQNFVFADKDGNLIKKNVSDTVTINNLKINDVIANSALIKNSLQIGTHSLFLEAPTTLGSTASSIYTDKNDNLLIQSDLKSAGGSGGHTIINGGSNLNGKVGIGMDPSANPEKLQVNGSIRATSYLLSDGTPLTGGNAWTLGQESPANVYLNTQGNVGIGSYPSEKVSILGNLRVDASNYMGTTYSILSPTELQFYNTNDGHVYIGNNSEYGRIVLTGFQKTWLWYTDHYGSFYTGGNIYANLTGDGSKEFSVVYDPNDVSINVGSQTGLVHLRGYSYGYNNLKTGPVEIMTVSQKQEYWTTDKWPVRFKTPISSAWVSTTPNEIGKYQGIAMNFNGWFFISSSSPSATLTDDGQAAPEYPFTVSTGGDVSIAGNTQINGSVGIGTCPISGYKFSVNGAIVATGFDVKLFTTCDYVFKPNYKLRSLNEVESYIKENSHLPEVPSAAEMDSNGVNLANMNSILLKKVEELTLYLIDQNKKIEEQQKELSSLRKQMEESMK